MENKNQMISDTQLRHSQKSAHAQTNIGQNVLGYYNHTADYQLCHKIMISHKNHENK